MTAIACFSLPIFKRGPMSNSKAQNEYGRAAARCTGRRRASRSDVREAAWEFPASGENSQRISRGHCVIPVSDRYWLAGARPSPIPARANAQKLRNDANGLRALGLQPASLLRFALASLPAPRSRRAAGQGQNQPRRGAQDGPSKRCERSLSVRNVCTSATAPDCPTFPRLRSVRAVGQSGALRAGRKHRIGRAWGRSLCWRSLGLAPASAVTGSVRAGALPSPCSAWGLRITALRPGGLRKLPLFQSASFLPFVSGRCGDLRAPLRWPTRNRSCHCCAIGLRALAPPKNQTSTKPGAIVVGRGSNVFNPPPKHHQRSSKPDQTPR
jgi:hypothetical protein